MNPNLLRPLLPPILFAVAMCIVGSLLLRSTQRELDAARRDAQQSEQARQSIRTRLADTQRDEAIIRATIQRFETWRQHGLIGTERRLDWADHLRAVRDDRRLPRLIYELMPQRPLRRADNTPVSSDQYNLQSSRMRLDLGLLHEGDLLRVLDDLQGRRDVLVVPRACRLERALSAARSNPREVPPALDAHCELDWITVLPPTRAASGS
ncbi:hypothetical protein [Uliginosibacterium sp. H1]|uniref:hypothetical protein n=1 Tax=Uliginosibacterium sp. H1 TaxID=3114757 RepID=UPI002E171006|nr:hypothetical protein [Uliginosibacterium sp. H1]